MQSHLAGGGGGEEGILGSLTWGYSSEAHGVMGVGGVVCGLNPCSLNHVVEVLALLLLVPLFFFHDCCPLSPLCLNSVETKSGK